jgi:predicted Rossmann fold flavoprotein
LTAAHKHIIIIGGGAAGFFSAINCARLHPHYQVTLLEKTTKLLGKVRVSGGGRCNVTHQCFDNGQLVKHYPRGEKELRQVFSRFSVQETIHWFEAQGVTLKVEEDGRMFPVTDSSETIIDCFKRLSRSLKIDVKTGHEVLKLEKNDLGFLVKIKSEREAFHLRADAVICAIGGHPKEEPYRFIKALGHTITPLLPSLFTINLPQDVIKKELQGIAVSDATVKLGTSKFLYQGPILVTHWGLSGPAVLKLSAFAAHIFFERNYESEILINWTGNQSEEEIKQHILEQQKRHHKALPVSQPLFHLPRRMWEFLCNTSLGNREKIWAEVNKKEIQKLTEVLGNSRYLMQGKTTFKEEFVTCGGVHLKEVDFKTMQSKLVSNLFFCGEVLNIDGITGGFNFQNAWSTAWIAAHLAGQNAKEE